MKKAACVVLLLAVLLPFAPTVHATTITIDTSALASTSVSSTVSQVNDWFQSNLGIDLYQVLNWVINFIVTVIKTTINVLLEILPKVKDFLSAHIS